MMSSPFNFEDLFQREEIKTPSFENFLCDELKTPTHENSLWDELKTPTNDNNCPASNVHDVETPKTSRKRASELSQTGRYGKRSRLPEDQKNSNGWNLNLEETAPEFPEEPLQINDELDKAINDAIKDVIEPTEASSGWWEQFTEYLSKMDSPKSPKESEVNDQNIEETKGNFEENKFGESLKPDLNNEFEQILKSTSEQMHNKKDEYSTKKDTPKPSKQTDSIDQDVMKRNDPSSQQVKSSKDINESKSGVSVNLDSIFGLPAAKHKSEQKQKAIFERKAKDKEAQKPVIEDQPFEEDNEPMKEFLAAFTKFAPLQQRESQVPDNAEIGESNRDVDAESKLETGNSKNSSDSEDFLKNIDSSESAKESSCSGSESVTDSKSKKKARKRNAASPSGSSQGESNESKSEENAQDPFALVEALREMEKKEKTCGKQKKSKKKRKSKRKWSSSPDSSYKGNKRSRKHSDSDSDDILTSRKYKSKHKANVRNGLDFYEDDSVSEDDRFSSDGFGYNEKLNSDFSNANQLNEYEELFSKMYQIFEQVPSRYKYEMNTVLYPTLVVVYLRMIASGKFRRGKTFVESSMRSLDHSLMPRIDKLMTLQCSADLPKKARRLLAGEQQARVKVVLCEQSYELLMSFKKSWASSKQSLFEQHFELIVKENNGVPYQQIGIGCAPLDKVYWATGEAVKEPPPPSPRAARRNRLKKTKLSPVKNQHMPIGNRLYTPMPRRWDLELQKDDEEHRVPLDKDNLPSIYIHDVREKTESVICATLSSKATMLAIGTQSGAVHVSSLTSTKLVKIKSAKSLEKLDTSTPGIDERMMDASSERMIRKLYGHQGSVYSCAFEPHDHFLLTSSQDRTVRCWCLFTWSCVVIYPGHMAAIYSVCYAPQGYYIATASEDRTVRIWTQDSRKSLCVLVGHLAEVSNCKFHPNRHYLATGSADCTVRLWDIIKGVQVRLFTGHRDGITALAFSTCGRYLVTGSNDHYIVVWDIEKEHLVRALSYHTAGINSIVFAMDNKLFMVGGQDGELSIWNFEHLVQEYDSDEIRKLTNSKRKSSKLKSDDLLVISYPTKESPFCELHITPRNLLLATCIFKMEAPDKESDMNKSTDDEELAMIKAYFRAQSNREKVVMKSTRDECGLDIFKSLMGYKIESPEIDNPEAEAVLDDVVDTSLKKEFHLSNEKLCESLDIILDDFDDIVDEDKRSVVNVFNNEVCNSNTDVVLEEKSKEQQQEDVVIVEEESTRPDIIAIPSESQMNSEQFKGYSTDSSTESEDVSDIRSLESSDSNNLQTSNIITKNWVNKNRIEELRKRQEDNKRKRKLPLKAVRRGILSRGKNLQLLQDNLKIGNQQVQNICQQNNTASNVLPPTKELKQSNLSEFDSYGTKNVNRNVRRPLLGYNDKPVGFNHGEKVNLINKDARNENNAVPKYEMDERKPVPHTIHETIDFKQPGIGNENKPLPKLNQKPNVENNCAGQNQTREYSTPQSVNYLRNQIAGNQYNTTQKFQMVPCNPRLDPNRKTIVGNIASGQNQTREHPGYADKIVSVNKKAGNQGSMVLKHQMKPQNPGCSVNYLTNQRVGNENTMLPKHQMVPRTLAFNPKTIAGFKRQEIECENKPALKLNMANNCTELNQTRGCPGNPGAGNQNRIIAKYQMVPRNPFLDPNHETIADFKRQDNRFGNKPSSQVYMTNNCYGPNPIRQCPGNYLRNQMAENQNRMVPKFQMLPRSLAPDPNRKTIADLKCQENRIGNKPTPKLNVENNSVNRNLYNHNILNIMESHDKSNTIIRSSNENGCNGNNMVTTNKHFLDNENTSDSDSGSSEYESSSDEVVEDISMKDSNSINAFLPQKANSKQNRKVSDAKPGTNQDGSDLQSESSDSGEVEEEAPKHSGPAFIPQNMSNERNKSVSAGITDKSTHYSKDGESSNSSSEKKDVTDDPKELSMKDKEQAQNVNRTTGKSMHYSTDDHSSDSNSEEDESSDDTEELSIKNDERNQKVYGGTGKLMFEDEASGGPKELSIKDKDNNTKVYGRGKIMFEEEERVPDEYKKLPTINNNENKKVYARGTGKSMYNSKDDESSDSNLEEDSDDPPIEENEHNGNVSERRTGKLIFEEEDKASDDPKELSIKDTDSNRKVYGRGKVMFEEEEEVPDEYKKLPTINNNENKKVYARGTGKCMHNSTDDESSDSNLEEEEVSEDPPIKENEPNGNVSGRRTGKLMFEEDDEASDYTEKLPMKEKEQNETVYKRRTGKLMFDEDDKALDYSEKLPMKEKEQNEKVYKRRTGKLMYEEEDKASDDPKELSMKDKEHNRKVYGRGKIMFEEEEEVPDEYKKLPTINNNENKKVYARGTGKCMHNSTDDESSDSNLEEEEVSEDPPIKENEPNGNVSGRRTGKLMFEEDDEASDHTKKLPLKETEQNENVYKRRTGKLMYEEEDKASDDPKELSMKDKEHNRIVYGRGKIMFEEEEEVPDEYKKLPTINNNENKKVYARRTGKSIHNSTDDESSDSNLEEKDEVPDEPPKLPMTENEHNGNVYRRRTGKLMFEEEEIEDKENSDIHKKLTPINKKENLKVSAGRTGKFMHYSTDEESSDSNSDKDEASYDSKELYKNTNDHTEKGRKTGKSMHCSTDDESSKDEVSSDDDQDLSIKNNFQTGKVTARITGKLMLEDEGEDACKKLPMTKKTDDECSHSYSGEDEASEDSDSSKGRKTGKFMRSKNLLEDESDLSSPSEFSDSSGEEKEKLNKKLSGRKSGKSLPPKSSSDEESDLSPPSEFSDSSGVEEEAPDVAGKLPLGGSEQNKTVSTGNTGKSMSPKNTTDDESDLSPPSEFSDSSGVEEETPETVKSMSDDESEFSDSSEVEEEAPETVKSMSDDESDLSPPSEFSDTTSDDDEALEDASEMSTRVGSSSEDDSDDRNVVGKNRSNEDKELEKSISMDKNSRSIEDQENITSELKQFENSSSNEASGENNIEDKFSEDGNNILHIEKQKEDFTKNKQLENKENINNVLTQLENSAYDEALDGGRTGIDANSSEDDSSKNSDDGINIMKQPNLMEGVTKSSSIREYRENKTEEESPGIGNSNVGDFKD